jgi:uridine phosphorylase
MKTAHRYPILDFDDSRHAIVNPSLPFKLNPSVKGCVLCFFQDVLQELKMKGDLKLVGESGCEMGPNPLYEYQRDSYHLAVLQPGVGAPLAAGFLEEVISLGLDTFIVCGGCGVLDPTLEVGFPIILTGAVRDEGTSYHYLPPGREVAAQKEPVAALQETFQAMGYPFQIAKTWTTDAIFRETNQRRNLRIAEGCRVVEMEAAALFAIAQFRAVQLGQVVYAGDLVIPDGWDKRDWNSRTSVRSLLFEISVQACIRLIQRKTLTHDLQG